MTGRSLHDWPRTVAEAIAIQRELAAKADTSRPLKTYATLAAADVSFNKFDPRLFAAAVVTRASDKHPVAISGVQTLANFPYVPGLLSFREAPAVIEAFEKLEHKPDVILCDGQGIAHPRRMGLACHLGLWLGIPTIGCAKSRLCGSNLEPGPNRGDRTPLIDGGELIGAVVRTRSKVKPLYVSPGHLCDLESAVEIVLAATDRYRLPIASRLAHEQVNALRRAASPSPI